jgi:DNA-binding MarR family transcriptional regulator
MSVGELVDVMVLPQSTLSHQLQRLERRGIIRRRRLASDNRSVVVTLTKEGKSVAEQCDRLGAAIYQSIAGNFSASEMETLRTLLGRMYDSLDNVVVPEELLQLADTK